LSEFIDGLLVVERKSSIFVRIRASVVVRALDYLEVTSIFNVVLFAEFKVLFIYWHARIDTLILDKWSLHSTELALVVLILL
jgi:hypothetical protein